MNAKPLYSALLAFLLSTLVIFSCKKDMKNEPVVPTPGNAFPIPAATPVTGSLSGLVVNENNAPVDGAEVRLGTAITTTDARGLFNFNNVTLDKYVSTVTVHVPGYFMAIRSFSANTSRNYVSIKLLPKILSGAINSTSADMVALGNGTQLSFQANSVIVKSTGAAYTGTVNVYASYIDPTANDISSVVPGSFMGRDADNMYALQSTGMIAVDLETPGGEALQLASNLPASIKLPIPSSLLGKAPASINTWSLDDQGVWVKEGTATKSGDFYEMQVTHFSFWNCDVPANAVYLTLHVQDQNGNSLNNTLVSLTIPNNNTWWATTYGYTDNLGNVSGLVPAGLALEMNVFPNPYSCANPVATQNIGPFSANTTLTVTVTISAAQVLTVTGTATDCNGQPLQNGTAVIYAGPNAYYYASVVNGNYNATITHCDPITSVNVTVWADSTNVQGNSGNVSVSGNSVTVPSITACGSSGAAVFIFANPQGSCQPITYSGAYIPGTPLTPNNVVVMFVNVTVPGTYAITTNTVNGISFSSSGVFTTTGQATVVLTGSGTPATTGIYTFTTQAAGVTGCSFAIPVSNTPAQANIDFSAPCPNFFINGIYSVGTPLNSSNTVTLTVNVISPGYYYIYTNMANGMSFSDSGTVTATGPVTIVLMGNGTPGNVGVTTFGLQSSNGATGCTFDINTTNTGTAANYVFSGAPGNCTSASLNGPFIAGTPITGQSTVTITVDVITPGTYNISTNNTNGMSFSANGMFTATGANIVTLIGSGTPTNTGTYTFVPQDGGITGCVFIIPVN